MKRVRIAKPYKLLRAFLLMFLGLYFSTLLVTGALFSRGEAQSQWIPYTVVKGDTLWHIAQIYTPEDKDIRDTLYLIQTENHISRAHLLPGDIIKVPNTEGVSYE